MGHSFDALAKIKEATDKYDPYLLWKVKDGRLDGSTIVFRTSKEKLEIAVQMQLGSQHSLEEEDCFLDAEHDRVKGMKTINLSVLHPTIKEIVTIASMEWRQSQPKPCVTSGSVSMRYVVIQFLFVS